MAIDMDTVVTVAGVIGSVLFFGRFYVQWIVSEVRKQYVIPIAFWYMSGFGSMLLFVYAFGRTSPGGTVGMCFNLIVYARNLMYVWRDKGVLTPARKIVTYGVVAVVTLTAGALTLLALKRGYRNTTEFWVWSAIWAVGQGLFFLRFLIQWAVTELKGKSVIPAIFWQLSIVGVLLHGAYFTYRADWLLAIGTFADGVPYVRNLWIMRHYGSKDEAPAVTSPRP